MCFGQHENLEILSQAFDSCPVDGSDIQGRSQLYGLINPSSDVSRCAKMMGATRVDEKQAPIPCVAAEVIRSKLTPNSYFAVRQVLCQLILSERGNQLRALCLDPLIHARIFTQIGFGLRKPLNRPDVALTLPRFHVQQEVGNFKGTEKRNERRQTAQEAVHRGIQGRSCQACRLGRWA